MSQYVPYTETYLKRIFNLFYKTKERLNYKKSVNTFLHFEKQFVLVPIPSREYYRTHTIETGTIDLIKTIVSVFHRVSDDLNMLSDVHTAE